MLQVIAITSLALRENLVALGIGRRAALEVQLSLELLVAIEVLQRIGRADFQHDERIVVRGLAQLAHLDPIAGRVHLPHVFDDAVPPRQLVVGANAEAEELIRGLDAGGGLCRGEVRAALEDQDGGDEGDQRSSDANGHSDLDEEEGLRLPTTDSRLPTASLWA